MLANLKESYPIFGQRRIVEQPIEGENEKYQEAWEKYKALAYKMIRSFSMSGVVGMSLEDLELEARLLLLQALRTHNRRNVRRPCTCKKTCRRIIKTCQCAPPCRHKETYLENKEVSYKFSTHYVTILHNHLCRLKQIFPTTAWRIRVFDPVSGEPASVPHPRTRDLTRHIDCRGISHLESMIVYVRSRGYTVSVCSLNWFKRAPMSDAHTALEVQNRENGHLFERDEKPLQQTDDSTVRQLELEMILDKIEDATLRKIVDLLIQGEKHTTVQKACGLKAYDYRRNIKRLQMLLAGEFGLDIHGK